MKHRFLLDVMVIYFAIEEKDDRGEADETCAEFIRLIGTNCHSIIVDRVLADKYWAHASELFKRPSLLTQASSFITQVLVNSSKLMLETAEAPGLPPGVRVPKEDEYLVRAALTSKPIVVTAERKLLNAINSQAADLHLKAVTPAEALELAKDA